MILLLGCNFINECSYINNTIKNEKGYKDVFKSNFCMYYYRKCSIWIIANNIGIENTPKNLLPFQHLLFHDRSK